MIPLALTIAGSDPGGGAGLQSDLRTFGFLGVYGLSVVAALTFQNSTGVESFEAVPEGSLRKQIEVLLEDRRPVASKTGMLASSQNVSAVADFAAAKQLGLLVVDPVLGSTSGPGLSEEGLAASIAVRLLPHCDLVTPNIAEAAELTGLEILGLEGSKAAARTLVEMGAGAACVTGGHLDGEPVDVLFDGASYSILKGTRVTGEAQWHGTGCLFSAAVTAHLALGSELPDAVASAKRLVESSLRHAVAPGRGMKVPWPAG
jgi:hydroxymethylpyrimidine/phosphomethylpyrimidine kinase